LLAAEAAAVEEEAEEAVAVVPAQVQVWVLVEARALVRFGLEVD
jgi:hypothetical protein